MDWKLSPVEVFSRLVEQSDYAYILESVEGPERLAEYSFVGLNPRLHVSVKDGAVEVHNLENDCKTRHHVDDPIPLLRALLIGFGRSTANVARFIGGAVGYISYDAVRYWERLPRKTVDDFGFPDFELAVYDDGVLFDHKRGEAYYYHYGDSRIREIEHLIKEEPILESLSFSSMKTSIEKEKFEELVVRCKEYIQSGDIFQAVLSKRFEFTFHGSLIPFYMALRRINPSPYMYFLKMGNRQIVGSSPEMLVRVEGGNVETFPIAGTRPRRPEKPLEDEALARDLLNDPKERAEHVMLVDLARNDIGKVCEYGSVHVPEFMKVYKYSHVQHMVSRVVGKLRKSFDCYDALRAVFPAGTVTGAPKVRAMEIIEELEPFRRGPYAGAVGYFSFNGNADFAITIRTLVAYGTRAYIQAGAGIVADSIPEREWFETEHKAQALLRALQTASGEKPP
ncbi:MAG: anthranilate synthase component I [Candidatus Bathyarchaeia archaeon]